jgi:hypothetical protein
MRFKGRKTPSNDKRTIRRFLFIPTKWNDEIGYVWLEWIKVDQRFVNGEWFDVYHHLHDCICRDCETAGRVSTVG